MRCWNKQQIKYSITIRKEVQEKSVARGEGALHTVVRKERGVLLHFFLFLLLS